MREDVLIPGAATVIVFVKVLCAYSEENVVVYPFVDWPNAMGTENFTARISDVAIGTGCRGGSEG